MAGAGWFDYVPGQVLSAASVQDYLMDQAVMVFASAAARTSALASPTEGMMSYRTDANMVEVYDGSAWKQFGATTGSVLQVISTTKVDTFTASVASNASSGDITGLTAAITPSATSSKVLITGSVIIAIGSGQAVGLVLYRNGSILTAGNGTAAGSRRGVIAYEQVGDNTQAVTLSFEYLDSPASTSAQTYSLRIIHSSGTTQTVYCNRTATDTDSLAYFRGQSTITALEVAG